MVQSLQHPPFNTVVKLDRETFANTFLAESRFGE